MESFRDLFEKHLKLLLEKGRQPKELVCILTREDQVLLKEEILSLCDLEGVSCEVIRPKPNDAVMSLSMCGVTIHFMIGPISCIGEMEMLR